MLLPSVNVVNTSTASEKVGSFQEGECSG